MMNLLYCRICFIVILGLSVTLANNETPPGQKRVYTRVWNCEKQECEEKCKRDERASEYGSCFVQCINHRSGAWNIRKNEVLPNSVGKKNESTRAAILHKKDPLLPANGARVQHAINTWQKTEKRRSKSPATVTVEKLRAQNSRQVLNRLSSRESPTKSPQPYKRRPVDRLDQCRQSQSNCSSTLTCLVKMLSRCQKT